jgi:hypothetical protein
MWYYESVSFQWQCNASAADSHRFAAGRVKWYNYALYHYAQQKSPSEDVNDFARVYWLRSRTYAEPSSRMAARLVTRARKDGPVVP